MKHSLSFLAGALLISASVVWTRGSLALMFVLGFFVAALTLGVALRVIGLSTVARFLLWVESRPHRRIAGDLPVFPLTVREPRSVDETGGLRSGLTADETRQTGGLRCGVGSNDRRGAKRRTGLQSRGVLPTLQQDVLSALCNLGVPFQKADQVVRGAAEGRPGISFDQLFRACVDALNVHRRAA